jgi:hypothetical protein
MFKIVVAISGQITLANEGDGLLADAFENSRLATGLSDVPLSLVLGFDQARDLAQQLARVPAIAAASRTELQMEQSVVEVIDHILELVHTCPQNESFRHRLRTIRDGIFLELPEERLALLCRVGCAVNNSVPSGTTNDRIDDYWYRIRDFMKTVFAGSPDQPQFVIKGGDGGTQPGERGGDVNVTLTRSPGDRSPVAEFTAADMRDAITDGLEAGGI